MPKRSEPYTFPPDGHWTIEEQIPCRGWDDFTGQFLLKVVEPGGAYHSRAIVINTDDRPWVEKLVKWLNKGGNGQSLDQGESPNG